MLGNIQSTMIRASAGSGKTWQLANRFLALMVLGVAPEKIIALTFTRKAAGEFTGRIMTRLAQGAASDDGAAALAGELSKVIQGTETIPALVRRMDEEGGEDDRWSGGKLEGIPTMDARFFQGKLESLIGSLDRLALSTLDSYFVRIVRNFSLELGLSGFDLMEDAAISAERLGVMTTIFSNQLTRKAEREAFLQSFKQATWGEEENRLCQTLEDFVRKHQNRWLTAPQAERWGGPDLLWKNGCPYPDRSHLDPDGTGGYIRKSARKLRDMLGEPYSPHKRYMQGWVKVCDLLENYVPGVPVKTNAQLDRAIPLWGQYAAGGLVEEKNKYEISPELGTVMTELIGTYIKSEIEVRMKRTQGLYAVISAYEARYHQHVRSRGRLCFSDLTLLLAGEGAMRIWDEDARSLIDFRLDARYDHWLLDEFQDTSQPQWQAIGNLVDEIMQDSDGHRSIFVVGDSKQSIYGWRGGEPRLFDDLKEHYGDRLAEWDMDRSFRSSRHVLDLVNTVCDLSAGKWRDLFPAAAIDRWVYHPHEPDADKPGHTLVLETALDPKEASSDEKTDARYACMKSLIEKVAPLNRGMTCAVLVSKNAHVTDIVDYLRRELPEMPVASESEAVVADGPEGTLFLDLFRWLQNPGHDFGRLHVSMSPLSQMIEELSGSKEHQEQWRWLTGEVARYGVEALVGRLVSDLQDAVELSEYGRSRLDEILAAANDFSSRGGSLDEWVMMLELRALKETTREGVIQVMTVHKCKGLGFDMVVLPELGSYKEFADAGRLDALEQKGDLGATDYVIKKPTKDICEADPALSAMMAEWEADQCYERFCNLYVALTRAKHSTYCILDPVHEKWTPKKKYDDWIREATACDGGGEIELGGEVFDVLFESGEWVELEDEKDSRIQPVESKVELPAAIPRMARKIASGVKKKKPGAILEHGKGIRFGNLVHERFSRITWLDELPELDGQVASQLVLDCVQSPNIRSYFERPAEEFQLLREQPFETRYDGSWLSGVIDRAVITLENGKPVRVDIIDFKTDRDKSASELCDEYKEQLITYRFAMAEITSIPEESIQCYLLSTALKEMVEIG